MVSPFDLTRHGIYVASIVRNAPPGRLYEDAIKYDKGMITSTGALLTHSGTKTGRSPKDKRIVQHPASSGEIWWGGVNIPLSEHAFVINRQRAVDYLNIRRRVYVIDGFAGWDPKYRQKIRIICARPYHALFMHNMLIRPTPEELEQFDEPDYTIFNAGEFPANPYTQQMSSNTTVELSFELREFVVLGTQYAGEMKKGVFSIMHYLMPKLGVLSMHCSANEGPQGDVSLFFGLSGTGKTTLSADEHRQLIGDDEHCWTDDGIFNIEGGCYAKCVNLSAESEPEIFQAIRFGSVLENAAIDKKTRVVDFADTSLTENTRAAYPLEYIPHAKLPAVGGHPRNVILLTCDAFGVLPPVSKLSVSQLMYHFMSGYTAKIAGTEMGVTEPQATFSACFGAAFLVWHPTKYAELLAQRMRQHKADAWLVNTGWSGGAYGAGSRIKLKHTRAIIDAIHSGALAKMPMTEDPAFGVQVPKKCPGVPDDMLHPRDRWADTYEYDLAAQRLVQLFRDNFSLYEAEASDETRRAAPRILQVTRPTPAEKLTAAEKLAAEKVAAEKQLAEKQSPEKLAPEKKPAGPGKPAAAEKAEAEKSPEKTPTETSKPTGAEKQEKPAKPQAPSRSGTAEKKGIS